MINGTLFPVLQNRAMCIRRCLYAHSWFGTPQHQPAVVSLGKAAAATVWSKVNTDQEVSYGDPYSSWDCSISDGFVHKLTSPERWQDKVHDHTITTLYQQSNRILCLNWTRHAGRWCFVGASLVHKTTSSIFFSVVKRTLYFTRTRLCLLIVRTARCGVGP